MQHRNIIGNEWTRMAIDSLYSRGEMADWQEFGEAMSKDSKIAESALAMAERHEDRGSAALARILVKRFHPQIFEKADGAEVDRFHRPVLSTRD